MIDVDVKVTKCGQCGGAAYLCELSDSTCRLKQAARGFLGDVDDAELRRLSALLRETEDGAWARVSEARTKRITKLEALVENVAESLPQIRRGVRSQAWNAREHVEHLVSEIERAGFSVEKDA